MTAHEWIDAFAVVLGTEAPDDGTVEQLLALAAAALEQAQLVR